jgi:hypothetical protein
VIEMRCICMETKTNREADYCRLHRRVDEYHVRDLLGVELLIPWSGPGFKNAKKFFSSPFFLIRLGASPSWGLYMYVLWAHAVC